MRVARFDILASIGTRLAIGAFPLAFVLVFGWAYGRQAFDVAAAAANWANYLNVLLLSGFVLVPPAIARLRGTAERNSERLIVRDHVALMRWLLVAGAVAAVPSWFLIGWAFPQLAVRSGDWLKSWYPLLALLALSQIPLALWLGVAQAAGQYGTALAWVALPRVLALTAMGYSAQAGAGPTLAMALAVGVVLAGQSMLVRSARQALAALDPESLRGTGRAADVLVPNLSAGAIGLVGTLVTIVPVTIVGHVVPDEVGNAHVLVTLSNAMGAVIVAAFFPLSLTLVQRAREPGGLRQHSFRVAAGVALITLLTISAAWLLFPVCAWISRACTGELLMVGSLVVLGAGLRLGSLGAYHAIVYVARPHFALPSAFLEAAAVVLLTVWLVPSFLLLALGVAFVVGGAVRLAFALTVELRLLNGVIR